MVASRFRHGPKRRPPVDPLGLLKARQTVLESSERKYEARSSVDTAIDGTMALEYCLSALSRDVGTFHLVSGELLLFRITI